LTSQESQHALAALEGAAERQLVGNGLREVEVELYTVGAAEGEQTWEAFKSEWVGQAVALWAALLVTGAVEDGDGALRAEHEWQEARLRARAAGPEPAAAWEGLGRGYCGLLRCLFGNPFATVALHPLWRTQAVVDVARSIYEARRFEDAPVLADALEEAG